MKAAKICSVLLFTALMASLFVYVVFGREFYTNDTLLNLLRAGVFLQLPALVLNFRIYRNAGSGWKTFTAIYNTIILVVILLIAFVLLAFHH